jgi:hypothetical protein
MQIVLDRHDRENPRRRQLLALHELRRGMERFATADAAVRRTDVALSRAELIRELSELIAALDRRVPQVERAGEASIARDAASLKVKALKRIAELEHQESLARSASAPSP